MTTHLPLKSLIMAGMLSFSTLLIPSHADARAQIGIYFGIPFYNSSMGDGYLYERGYGWYAPEYRSRFRYNYGNFRVSCNEAVRHLRNNGYSNVVVVECVGPRYTFQARKAGRNVQLSYNARTRSFGRI